MNTWQITCKKHRNIYRFTKVTYDHVNTLSPSQNLSASKSSHRTSGPCLTRRSQDGFCVCADRTLDYWHVGRSMLVPAQYKQKRSKLRPRLPWLGSALLYINSLSSVSNNMQIYRQCVQQTNNIKKQKQKKNDKTQNTACKEVSFCSLSHSNTAERAFQKIAYIPEKEYNYSSVHNCDTSHFFVR